MRSESKKIRSIAAVIGRRRFMAWLGAVSYALSTERNGLAEDSAPDFRMIVHPDNPTRFVNRHFLARAFMKEVTEWDDGADLKPVDLRSDSKTREKFSDAVLHKSVAAVRSYWQQRIFSGLGLPPPELDTDDDVVRYVLKYRGSVGYVSGRADIGKARAVGINYD